MGGQRASGKRLEFTDQVCACEWSTLKTSLLNMASIKSVLIIFVRGTGDCLHSSAGRTRRSTFRFLGGRSITLLSGRSQAKLMAGGTSDSRSIDRIIRLRRGEKQQTKGESGLSFWEMGMEGGC